MSAVTLGSDLSRINVLWHLDLDNENAWTNEFVRQTSLLTIVKMLFYILKEM